MRILMAGASGFLGSRLAALLREQGHDIVRLVRRPARDGGEASWQPSAGQLDPALVAAADAVVNLAGAGVGDRRWTPAYKNLIRRSRVDTAGTIAGCIAHLPPSQRPRVLLQGSAVGWYGDTGERPVTEDAPAGTGLLADVCRVWEAAVRPAEDAGVRTVLLRTGLPLDQQGGLLKPQLLPFRLGLGAALGAGRQWVPWISLRDWLDACTFLLQHPDLSGPVNIVGPAPVTNAEFTRELAQTLHRPAVLKVPALALHALLGEFAGEALRSQRVLPAVLERAGFRWTHPDVAAALRAALAPTQGAAA